MSIPILMLNKTSVMQGLNDILHKFCTKLNLLFNAFGKRILLGSWLGLFYLPTIDNDCPSYFKVKDLKQKGNNKIVAYVLLQKI